MIGLLGWTTLLLFVGGLVAGIVEGSAACVILGLGGVSLIALLNVVARAIAKTLELSLGKFNESFQGVTVSESNDTLEKNGR